MARAQPRKSGGEGSESTQMTLSERVIDVFGDQFPVLDRLQNATQATPTDEAALTDAREAIEDLEHRGRGGMEEADRIKIGQMRALLDSATSAVAAAEKIADKEKKKKKAKPSAEELRERRAEKRQAEEAVQEPEAEKAEIAGGEQVPMDSYETIADEWNGAIDEFERRIAYFDRWFLIRLNSQDDATRVAKRLVDEMDVMSDDVIATLSSIGTSIATIEDVPDALRDSVRRFNEAYAMALTNRERAGRYDELVAERRREFEEKMREAEPIAQASIDTYKVIEADIARVLALPHETYEERYIARSQLEALRRSFTMYHKYWGEEVDDHLPSGSPVRTKVLDAQSSAHRAYIDIKKRHEEFLGVAAQDWLANSQRFSARLDVIRTRLIKARMLRDQARQDELAGIKEYYASVKEDWGDLRDQVSRELQQEEGSPVKILGRVVRGIGADVEALLSEKDAKVLQAQEVYGELGWTVIRSRVCWNDEKTSSQRGSFLHRYLDSKVKESDPEFAEFVRDRDIFMKLVEPLEAAKYEIDVQASHRRVSIDERRNNERRRKLNHPWLLNLRADRVDLADNIIAGRFWKQDTSVEERQRLIRLGDSLNDDDPALVAAVRSVRRDVPIFQRAVAELEASKQAITAFEDRLLTDEQDPVVPIDAAQLQNLAKRYSRATGHEYNTLEFVLALEDWKISDREARRKAVGEYLRRPLRQTAEKFTDKPEVFREPLDAWRSAVQQKLNRRDAFRWALEKNRELIPGLGKLSPSVQRMVDIVLADTNRPAPEPEPVPAPETLDARGEAIRDHRSEIGNLLAEDIFWDRKVRRSTRLARINVMLNHGRAEARLHSDFGLRNKADFYDAAGFTDFADLETRMARIRKALIVAAPTVDAAVAAAASAPAAAGTPAVPAIRNVAPAPVSAPTPAVVARPPAPAPSASRPAPVPPPSSRPASTTAPVAAAAATGAAAILSRLTGRVEPRRTEAPAPSASPLATITPPPLPAMERVAAATATAGSPEADRSAAPAPIAAPTPEQAAPRAAPASVRAALPPAPTLVRRGESAPAIGTAARTAESAAASRPEPLVTGAPTPIDAARIEPAVGGGAESVAPSASRLAPPARPPMRRELPPPPELTNEVRVSSWAKSIRSTVGRWFGRDLGDYVASELTGEQMERERRNEAMSRPEAMARTVSSLLGIAGRALGFQSFVDVPRYFTQSFMKENERAFLRAGILEAMEHESLGREGDRQRASLEASTRLERAINTSAHLTSEQKAEMITRVNTMRVTYQERSFAVAEARSIALTELIEANVQAKVNGWRAAKETVNSALAVLSFGGAPLVAGVSYGAARGVSYLAMSLQEKYVAAAVQNPRASWVGKAQAAFRDTLTSTWNRLSARTETVGQRFMNAVDALAEIGNAVGVQTGPAISGLERSLPALRSLEGSTDSGIAQIVANAQQAIQATIDRILPVFERLTARQASNPATT